MKDMAKLLSLALNQCLSVMLVGGLLSGCNQEITETRAVQKQAQREEPVVEPSQMKSAVETEQTKSAVATEPTNAADKKETTEVADQSVKPEDDKALKAAQKQVPAEDSKSLEPAQKQDELKAEQDATSLLKQDVRQLKTRLEQGCKNMQINSIDRRQGMGERVDALLRHRSAGNRALEDGDYLVAQKSYQEAAAVFAWLKENLPRRDAVAAKLNEMKQRERDLMKKNIKRYALVSFTLTGNLLREAQQAFDNGQFTAASNRLVACQEGFDNAWTEMLQVRMKDMQKEARVAANKKTREGWETVLKLAEEMSTIDAAIGKEWRERAQEHLLEKGVPEAQAPATTEQPVVQQEAVVNTPKKEIPHTTEVAVVTVPEKVNLAEEKTETAPGGTVEQKHETGVDAKNASGIKGDFNGVVVLPGGGELRLVRIKAGSFVMGSPRTENAHENNEKSHQVTLTRDYWIGETEVTQAQWRAVGVEKAKDCHWQGDTLPVECVSWHEAIVFCQKLNAWMDGKLPTGYQFSLPTEAQWEYACRGGQSQQVPFNFGSMLNGSQANCDGTCPYGTKEMGTAVGRTTPVKHYPPNAFGLYDMHGNVWEWCLDCSDFDYELYTNTYIGKIVDPLGDIGSFRMRRGGSWNNFAVHCRTASRNSREADCRDSDMGFRIVLTTKMK